MNHKTAVFSSLRFPVAVVLAAALPFAGLLAQPSNSVFEWDVDADGDWDVASNWDQTAGPAADFPDDPETDAILQGATDTRTVTLPQGETFLLERLLVAENQSFIIAGDGKLEIRRDGTFGGGSGRGIEQIRLGDGALLQLDSDIDFVNRSQFAGPGTVIANGQMDFESTLRDLILDEGITLRLNAQINRIRSLSLGQETTLELGISGDLGSDFAGSVNMNRGSTLRPHGENRSMSTSLSIEEGTVIDVQNHDLELTGNVFLDGSSGFGNHGFGGTMQVDTGTLTISGTVAFDSPHLVQGDNPLELLNGGTLVLAGTGNTGSNDLHWFATGTGTGTLEFANTAGSATGSGNEVSIFNNVVLTGDGATASAVRIRDGGTIAPGNSPGTLDTGTLTIDQGGNLNYTFNVNGEHGVLAIDGDLDLTEIGNLNLFAVEYITGPTTLLTYSGDLISPNFDMGFDPFFENFFDSEGNPSSLPSGMFIDYGTGIDSAISIIPEPRTYVLLTGLLALGLALYRRRRI